jgi:catechol 2,3-dioxygenase-like lactoylglutathione lyase family enzyme
MASHTTRLQTLFYYCNDIDKMRHFYTELLSFEETFYRNDSDHGWLTYQVGELNLVFIRSQAPVEIPETFASQPGFSGGSEEIHSWVLQVPTGHLDGIRIRMLAARIPTLWPEIQSPQEGHRIFVVRDPAGRTIELFETA